MWLNLWLPKVTEYSGNALLVLPDMFVEGGRYARSFATILNQHRFVVKGAHRYPDPDYALFKQVVILLSKRPRYGYFSDYTNGIPLTDILHRTTQANEFIISNGSPHVMMYLRPEQPAEGVLTEEYALSKHGEFFGSPLNGFFLYDRPCLCPLNTLE